MHAELQLMCWHHRLCGSSELGVLWPSFCLAIGMAGHAF